MQHRTPTHALTGLILALAATGCGGIFRHVGKKTDPKPKSEQAAPKKSGDTVKVVNQSGKPICKVYAALTPRESRSWGAPRLEERIEPGASTELHFDELHNAQLAVKAEDCDGNPVTRVYGRVWRVADGFTWKLSDKDEGELAAASAEHQAWKEERAKQKAGRLDVTLVNKCSSTLFYCAMKAEGGHIEGLVSAHDASKTKLPPGARVVSRRASKCYPDELLHTVSRADRNRRVVLCQ